MLFRSQDRKSIVEDLLDIQIFSVMNGLLKYKISENKEKANSIAQIIVKKETQRRICKNELCKHFSHNHIRNGETCLVADCKCIEFTK